MAPQSYSILILLFLQAPGIFVHGQTTDPFDRSNPVSAQTEYGPIEGFIHAASDGTSSNVFLGVPYAKPPIGDLRFERPLPPDSWSSTLQTKQFRNACIPYRYANRPLPPDSWSSTLQTKQFRNACIPYRYANINANVPISEDCLYVNVIAPTEPSDDPSGYPVLVYIHGGGFWYGNVIRAGFDKATKVFASRGLITITMPYRVGLYDSAGSASVDLLTLSPHSRNLFHKAIEGSGAGSCEFAGSQPSTRVTKQLAAAMGCASTNPNEIKAFLKSQTWQDIMNVSSNQFVPDKAYPNYLGWGPRYDHDFFDGKTIEQLIKEAPPKPLIAGLMSLEGGGFIGLAGQPASVLAAYNAANFTAKIRSTYAPQIIAGPEFQAIQNDIINYFIYHNAPENATSEFYIRRHAELYSDLFLNQQVLYETDLKVLFGWPVYFYLWDHMSAPVQATLPQAKGAWHTSEIYYVFDQLVRPADVLGPEELKVQSYYADIFAQFAYTGNPRTPENRFPRYDLLTRRSLWIDPTLSIKWNWITERRLFWAQHVSKFNYNILRGRTRSQIINGSPLDN
uniref:Carboxylesterase type B domain-containing protein n=1 Tax=Panagrolaimus sp. PS1159 TaxID=55785 RepID=A0AC35ESN5_9BILA